MSDDYTPEQKMVMVGPGFMEGLFEGLLVLAVIAVVAALVIGFGIGWLVFA